MFPGISGVARFRVIPWRRRIRAVSAADSSL